MGSDAAIASVVSRIGSIERRFEPAASPRSGEGPVPVVDTGPEFDPFGEAYQRALAARDANVGRPATDPVLDQPFVAAVPTTWMTPVTGAVVRPGTIPGSSHPLITAAIGGALAAPGERPVGGYGRMPLPSGVRGFDNGQLPAESLTSLASQPRHRLFGPAASSWDSVVAAARADGIELRITDSYRPYAEQVDLVRRKGLYSQGGLAATPGTSNHGWGLAVDADVTDNRTLQWLKVNGPRFGWVESVPREPWHWEFRPDQV